MTAHRPAEQIWAEGYRHAKAEDAATIAALTVALQSVLTAADRLNAGNFTAAVSEGWIVLRKIVPTASEKPCYATITCEGCGRKVDLLRYGTDQEFLTPLVGWQLLPPVCTECLTKGAI